MTILVGSFTGLSAQIEFTEKTECLETELHGGQCALNIFALLPSEPNSGRQ